jgi:hypothetical protein
MTSLELFNIVSSLSPRLGLLQKFKKKFGLNEKLPPKNICFIYF